MIKKLKNESKKSRKKKIISIATLLFIGLILSSILLATANTQIADVGERSSEINEEVRTTGTDIAPASSSGRILVDDSGSRNWQWAKEEFNLPGSGTKADPYIIQSKIIDSGASGSCIYIKNSNKHFIIRSCTLYNSMYAGIKLRYTTNGKISGNIIHSNEIGIDLGKSDKNVINSANIIYGNNLGGILLLRSDYNIIHGNYIFRNGDGIRLKYSINNMIAGNTVAYNDWGIFLTESSNSNIIWANNVDNNFYGIWLQSQSNDGFIVNNDISNNLCGITLYYAFNNQLVGNIFVNNDMDIWIYP